MSLVDRYQCDECGLRLDHEDNKGTAIDIYGALDPLDWRTTIRMWVRDAEGNEVTIYLDAQDIEAMRNGLNRILKHAGYAREVSVIV